MPEESPREHIRRIRQAKFGLRDDGTRLNENALAQDLGNALHRLSQDLYSNVHHFILELIQNAEDNDYLDDDAKLIFELRSDDPTETPGSSGCLCVLNNETGFTNKNVGSICAVGQSTKSGQQGYIGEKGIGFKSVFVVSPRPHIYSNGYLFYFRRDSEDSMGYIVPHWNEHQRQSAVQTPCGFCVPLWQRKVCGLKCFRRVAENGRRDALRYLFGKSGSHSFAAGMGGSRLAVAVGFAFLAMLEVILGQR